VGGKSLFLTGFAIGLLVTIGIASAANSAAIQMTPTPAPTSTYIQWRDPAPKGTEPPPIFVPMPTPVPFADMPLLYFYDEAHNTDCWVTFNHMAVSCLRRQAFWPCEGKASQ
jgi:hypothetical protein